MSIITIAANKGGTGKTTTAVTLASWFARQGATVLLVDLDGQNNASMALGVKATRATAADVLNNTVQVEDAIQSTGRDNLYIIPAGPDMNRADVNLAQRPARGIKRLAQALAPIRKRFDVVFVDTAPASMLSAVTQTGLYAAGHIVCPVETSALALATLEDLYGTIIALQDDADWQGDLRLVIPTKMDSRRNADHKALAAMYKFCGGQAATLIPGEAIPELAAFRTATAEGKTIWEYAPHSPGAQAYAVFAESLMPLVGIPA